MTEAIKKQWDDLKSKHPDALLLFRCGDFYETYCEDAKVCAKVLGITLTWRTPSKRHAPGDYSDAMAGFPHHALDTYLPKLIRTGKRVAICDQLEDPKLTKRLVKRGITELVSPATKENNNNQKTETMETKNIQAADLIGKRVNVNGSNNYYVVKSVIEDTLQTEMHMGERVMPCPMPMSLLRTMLDAGKYVIGEDAVAEVKVTDPTPAPPLDGRGAATASEPTAKTIDMKPTTEKPATEKPVATGKPQGTPRPSKGKAASKREQNGTRSDSAEREQARPKVKGRGGVTPAKAKLTYVTYQTSKGKTQGRICGFSEGDAAYVNGQDLHGSAYPVNGVLCLSFSKAFTPWAEQMCKALNEGKTIDELRTMLADYEAKRAADQAAWKEKREAWKQSHTEGADLKPETVKPETKGGYSDADVAAMLKKIMAGGAIPEDIKRAMAA